LNAGAAILERLRPRGIRLGLETLDRLLQRLDRPEARCAAVLVAGTNGKGSTAALLAAMTGAAGYRTGLFTSPALERLEDQFRIDGERIDGGKLGALLAEVEARSGDLPLTEFEALTAAAFLHFARQRVELAVLEAGLGGRGDATNVAEPRVSVLTTVAFDHAERLGSTLAAIAADKAGVLRAGRPLVLGWIGTAEAEAAILEHARQAGAPVRRAPDEVRDLAARPGDGGAQRVTFATVRREYAFDLPLAGAHQARNLATAVLAAEALAEDGFARLKPAALARGVAACTWPGRCEWLHRPGERSLLLDSAHNPSGIEALASYLDEVEGPLDLLFGALRDKPAVAMLERLRPRVGRIVLTAPQSERAWDPRTVAAAVGNGCTVDCTVEPDLPAALGRALARPGPPLLVTGSLLLVGQVRCRIMPR